VTTSPIIWVITGLSDKIKKEKMAKFDFTFVQNALASVYIFGMPTELLPSSSKSPELNMRLGI